MQALDGGAANDVVDQIDGMHTHQHRAGGGQIALGHHHMLGIFDGVGINRHFPLAANGVIGGGFGHALHQLFRAATMGD